MGSGASNNLSSEQKILLSRELQSAYDKCTADNLEEDIIQCTLASEYKRIVESFEKENKVEKVEKVDKAEKVEKVDPVPSAPVRELSSLSSKFSSKNKDTNKPAKFTRRRSFDTARTGKKDLLSVSKEDLELTKVSLSEATIKPAEEVLDSWDSVTQQPFCEICQMAFKSLSFLDRHMKYSDLHLKNVERKNKKDEGQKAVEAIPKMASVEEEQPLPSVSVKLQAQTEGTHYKLLYTGSKFFWRTQKNIDIDVYLHVLPNVIEVISFDPVKHKEASRIYLNYSTIQGALEQLVVADYEEKIKELTQDRFFSLDDEAALRDKLLVQRVTTYILQRLQLDSSGTLGEVLFVELSGDKDLVSPLLTEAPSALVPVSLTRRRRTSSQEIEATINSINFDRALIGEAIEQAHALSKSPIKTKTSFVRAREV